MPSLLRLKRDGLLGCILISTTIFASTQSAGATETVTYTYDAKGRLVKVERSGSVNNNVRAEYTLDKAENRTNVTVSGSPN
ncbi:hypothetical protein [Blastomonas sp. CCH5-A3]|jgi:hypothetical protein|uniref:hypothetical protein n=1 Tax=Blastomonas sp. CCH5-A3 TaxID=1768761 RepID=UPI000A4A78EF|nr:hypothetical protein [Blastomonas sp. CCH5-A3]